MNHECNQAAVVRISVFSLAILSNSFRIGEQEFFGREASRGKGLYSVS